MVKIGKLQWKLRIPVQTFITEYLCIRMMDVCVSSGNITINFNYLFPGIKTFLLWFFLQNIVHSTGHKYYVLLLTELVVLHIFLSFELFGLKYASPINEYNRDGLQTKILTKIGTYFNLRLQTSRSSLSWVRRASSQLYWTSGCVKSCSLWPRLMMDSKPCWEEPWQPTISIEVSKFPFAVASFGLNLEAIFK